MFVHVYFVIRCAWLGCLYPVVVVVIIEYPVVADVADCVDVIQVL